MTPLCPICFALMKKTRDDGQEEKWKCTDKECKGKREFKSEKYQKNLDKIAGDNKFL